jgi:hypothetical protein
MIKIKKLDGHRRHIDTVAVINRHKRWPTMQTPRFKKN